MLIKALVRNSREFKWCGPMGYVSARRLVGPLVQLLSRGPDGSALYGFVVQSSKTGTRMTFVETCPLTNDGRTFISLNGSFSIIVGNV